MPSKTSPHYALRKFHGIAPRRPTRPTPEKVRHGISLYPWFCLLAGSQRCSFAAFFFLFLSMNLASFPSSLSSSYLFEVYLGSVMKRLELCGTCVPTGKKVCPFIRHFRFRLYMNSGHASRHASQGPSQSSLLHVLFPRGL